LAAQTAAYPAPPEIASTENCFMFKRSARNTTFAKLHAAVRLCPLGLATRYLSEAVLGDRIYFDFSDIFFGQTNSLQKKDKCFYCLLF
jgi:hypothetical protein